MRIFVFGSSITSCYWNGAATYYRGIYQNLAALGHEITFAEPDIYARQQNRDRHEVNYADVIVYRTPVDIDGLLAQAADAGLVVKHSGLGADDELLEARVLECRSACTQVAFWDVDAPATLARVEADAGDPFRRLIPQYDFIFTYGGGAPVVRHYSALGARNCHPVYNALEAATHHPVPADPALACDLLFVGNRLPDREQRVDEFFLRAAELAPEMSFMLGGEGWSSKSLPPNVRWIGHVATSRHNSLNCSARMVLNVNRESMAKVGFSPPTRIFEAAGAAACLITDHWAGIEAFFAPGREVLVAASAADVVVYLRGIDAREARSIGGAMRGRALKEHTYGLRAAQVHAILQASTAGTQGGKTVAVPSLLTPSTLPQPVPPRRVPGPPESVKP
jgi:spore maturation protein CgeB